MDPLEAYAPPKSRVIVSEAEADASVPRPRVPAFFKIMLGLVMAVMALGVVMSPAPGTIAWFLLMCLAGWKTCEGHVGASRALGVMLVLNGVGILLALMGLFQRRDDPGMTFMLVYCLVMGAWVFALAGCIWFHPAMRAAFRRAKVNKWSGA